MLISTDNDERITKEIVNVTTDNSFNKENEVSSLENGNIPIVVKSSVSTQEVSFCASTSSQKLILNSISQEDTNSTNITNLEGSTIEIEKSVTHKVLNSVHSVNSINNCQTTVVASSTTGFSLRST